MKGRFEMAKRKRYRVTKSMKASKRLSQVENFEFLTLREVLGRMKKDRESRNEALTTDEMGSLTIHKILEWAHKCASIGGRSSDKDKDEAAVFCMILHDFCKIQPVLEPSFQAKPPQKRTLLQEDKIPGIGLLGL
jgi:hypothetical protein